VTPASRRVCPISRCSYRPRRRREDLGLVTPAPPPARDEAVACHLRSPRSTFARGRHREPLITQREPANAGSLLLSGCIASAWAFSFSFYRSRIRILFGNLSSVSAAMKSARARNRSNRVDPARPKTGCRSYTSKACGVDRPRAD